MQIITTANGRELELSLRRNALPILGTCGAEADAHRKMILWLEEALVEVNGVPIDFTRINKELISSHAKVKKLLIENKITQHIADCRQLDLAIAQIDSITKQAVQLRSKAQFGVETAWQTYWKNAESCREIAISKFTALEQHLKTLSLEADFTPEVKLALHYLKYIFELSILYMDLKFKLANCSFHSSEQALFTQAVDAYVNRGANLLRMIGECKTKSIRVRKADDGVEVFPFQHFFINSIHDLQREARSLRPLFSVRLSVADETILFADVGHCNFISNMYGLLYPREKISNADMLQRIKNIETQVSEFEAKFEKDHRTLVLQYDYARLWHWIFTAKLGVIEKTPKIGADIISAVQSKLLFHQQISIDLLEAIIDGRKPSDVLVESTVLSSLYIYNMALTHNYCIGSQLNAVSMRTLAQTQVRCEELKRSILQVTDHMQDCSVYVHDVKPMPIIRGEVVNVYFKRLLGEHDDAFKRDVKRFLNSAMLGSKNKILAKINFRHVTECNKQPKDLKVTESIITDVKECANAIIHDPEFTNIEKAEAQYFLSINLYRQVTLFAREYNVMKYHVRKEQLEKIVAEALQQFAKVDTKSLSADELQLFSLYELELTAIQYLLLPIETSIANLVLRNRVLTKYFSVSSLKEVDLTASNETLLKQFEAASFETNHLSLAVHWLYIKEEVVSDINRHFLCAAHRVEVLTTEQRISDAYLQVLMLKSQSLQSEDVMVAYFAHWLLYEANRTCEVATKFLYATQQAKNALPELVWEKMGRSEILKAQPNLEKEAEKRLRDYHEWRSKKPPEKMVEILTDSSNIGLIRQRLQERKQYYCGCSACDQAHGFEFKNEATRVQVFAITRDQQFWNQTSNKSAQEEAVPVAASSATALH